MTYFGEIKNGYPLEIIHPPHNFQTLHHHHQNNSEEIHEQKEDDIFPLCQKHRRKGSVTVIPKIIDQNDSNILKKRPVECIVNSYARKIFTKKSRTSTKSIQQRLKKKKTTLPFKPTTSHKSKKKKHRAINCTSRKQSTIISHHHIQNSNPNSSISSTKKKQKSSISSTKNKKKSSVSSIKNKSNSSISSTRYTKSGTKVNTPKKKKKTINKNFEPILTILDKLTEEKQRDVEQSHCLLCAWEHIKSLPWEEREKFHKIMYGKNGRKNSWKQIQLKFKLRRKNRHTMGSLAWIKCFKKEAKKLEEERESFQEESKENECFHNVLETTEEEKFCYSNRNNDIDVDDRHQIFLEKKTDNFYGNNTQLHSPALPHQSSFVMKNKPFVLEHRSGSKRLHEHKNQEEDYESSVISGNNPTINFHDSHHQQQKKRFQKSNNLKKNTNYYCEQIKNCNQNDLNCMLKHVHAICHDEAAAQNKKKDNDNNNNTTNLNGSCSFFNNKKFCKENGDQDFFHTNNQLHKFTSSHNIHSNSSTKYNESFFPSQSNNDTITNPCGTQKINSNLNNDNYNKGTLSQFPVHHFSAEDANINGVVVVEEILRPPTNLKKLSQDLNDILEQLPELIQKRIDDCRCLVTAWSHITFVSKTESNQFEYLLYETKSKKRLFWSLVLQEFRARRKKNTTVAHCLNWVVPHTAHAQHFTY